MESPIRIKDDFISKSLQNEIEKTLLWRNFPYYYHAETTFFNEEIFAYQERVDKNTKDSPQLCHIAMRDGVQSSEFWPLISPIFYQAMNDFDMNIEMERCKVNLMLKDGDFNPNEYNPPHFDTDNTTSYIGIYYVSNSDGDTLCFETPHENFTKEAFKVIKRASPKKGRFLFFPADTLHAGRPPTIFDSRCVINFIFKVRA